MRAILTIPFLQTRVLATVFVCVFASPAFAQTLERTEPAAGEPAPAKPAPTPVDAAKPGAPVSEDPTQAESTSPGDFAVIAWGLEAFRIAVGAPESGISAAERARILGARIESIDPEKFDQSLLAVQTSGRGRSAVDELYYDDALLVRVTPEDLAAADIALTDNDARAAYIERLRAGVAQCVQARAVEIATPAVESVNVLTLTEMIQAYLADQVLRRWVRDIGLSIVLALVLLIAIWVLTRIFNFTYARLENLKGGFERPLRFRGRDLVSAATVRTVFVGLLRIVHLAIALLIVLFFSNSILGLFPEYDGLPVKVYVRGGIYVVLITSLAVGVYRLTHQVFDFLRARIRYLRARRSQTLSFQNVTFLTAAQIASLADSGVRVLRFVTYLVLGYLYLTAVFGVFQFTRKWSGALLEYFLEPVRTVAFAIVAYLPNIFFIVVIGFAAFYSIRLLRLFFVETARGRITIPGFYPDWALPTHRLLSFLLIAFAIVMAFPYLPGAESEAFRGVSIFLGFMVSLGSSALIGNIMAGIVVTYMRPFKIGDRVKIADTVGDVIEKTLLVTRIRTIKNVEITIPNGLVLASHIINYSSVTGAGDGLVLHTSITIGYDVPWRTVHQLLLAAAGAVREIRTTPPPFVLQTSLDDYYVSYQLNAYTDQPNRMAHIYSALHGEIQDQFFKAGVEILSPHYYALRDGNAAAVPADHLPENYMPPKFRVDAGDAGPST